MIIEQMESRLETWKRLVWISLGASASLLAGAAADWMFTSHHPGVDQYASWLIVWLLVQIVSVFPAARLIVGRDWRKLPVSFRLNIIFGSLAASWIALFSFCLRVQSMVYLSPLEVIFFIFSIGFALAGMYFHLRRQLLTTPESMFP